MYPNHSTKSIDLHSVRWHLFTGSSRHYLSIDITPPTPKVSKVPAKMEDQKFCKTAPHCSEAYCDDSMLIATNKNEHQMALDDTDMYCHDFSLSLKPSNVFHWLLMGNATIQTQLSHCHLGRPLTSKSIKRNSWVKSSPTAPKPLAKELLTDSGTLFLPNSEHWMSAQLEASTKYGYLTMLCSHHCISS